MRPKWFGLWAGALMLAAGAGGCAPMRVSAHVDSHTDFARFKTFDWGPADALPAGDPRLDRSGFFQDHMQGAVEKQMLLKGYRHTSERETPDLRIHFHAVTRERMNVEASDARRGLCEAVYCGGGVGVFEEGTLIVDVIDARSNRLVWRGWAQDTVGDSLENQDKLTQRINRAVKGLMDALPSRPRQSGALK